MAGFVAAVDPVDRLAEESPGFVWRLPATHSTGLTLHTAGRSPLIVNLSVWRSYEALHAFVYRSPHGRLLTRRGRWVLPLRQPSTALWWVRVDDQPDVEQALARLQHLRSYGPSPRAFGLRRRFDPAGRPVSTPQAASPQAASRRH
jgi:hypothetical protein